MIYQGKQLYGERDEFLNWLTDKPEIRIPDGATEVKRYMFYLNKTIREVVLPGSVKTIREAAFQESTLNYTNLENIENIANKAFFLCKTLVLNKNGNILNLPNLKILGTSAFQGASFYANSVEYINLPSLEKIGDSAFREVPKLKQVFFPTKMSGTMSGLFTHCSALLKFDIPYGITSLGNYLCYNCMNLLELTIPDTVVTTSSATSHLTFGNCPKCKTVYTNVGNSERLRTLLEGKGLPADYQIIEKENLYDE